MKILCQHVLVETSASQSTTCITASEVCIRTARAVKLSAGRDVVYAGLDGKVDGFALGAVVGQQGDWCESPVDDGFGWWLGIEGLGRAGAGEETVVGEEGEESEEDEVDGCKNGSSRRFTN